MSLDGAGLKEGKYTPGQIDSQRSEEIKKDFLQLVKNNHGKLPMSQEQFEQYMRERNWKIISFLLSF